MGKKAATKQDKEKKEERKPIRLPMNFTQYTKDIAGASRLSSEGRRLILDITGAALKQMGYEAGLHAFACKRGTITRYALKKGFLNTYGQVLC